MDAPTEGPLRDEIRDDALRPLGGRLWPFRVVGALLVGALVIGAALAVISDQSPLSWSAVAVVGLLGGLTYWLGVSSQLRQMKHQRRYLDLLAALATRDDLTGLYNRRYFHDQLREEWRRCQRYHRPFSLILFDVDDLKAINDRYGHAAGDQALRHVALCLRAGTRSADVVARWGGDEFAVLAPEAVRPQAEQLAERLQGAIASVRALPPEVAEDPVMLRVSYGITTGDESFLRPDDIFVAADKSLYAARKAQRPRPTPAALPQEPSSPAP